MSNELTHKYTGEDVWSAKKTKDVINWCIQNTDISSGYFNLPLILLETHRIIGVDSFMPSLAIRQLHDLMRYRCKLTNFGSSEKNRIQNCLTVSNIQLSNVVSDTFGKSSIKIINHLLENPDDKDFDFVPLLHASMLKKVDDLRF